MAGLTGFWQQSDALMSEFTRCWTYLGQLGIMAKDMATLLDGETRNGNNTNYENDVTVKKAQLEKIAILMGKVAGIEVADKKVEPKKCNFYNRGFCKMGSECKFLHNDKVCESFVDLGICEMQRCNKRHQYHCKYLNSENGCRRGELCEFSHKKDVTFEKVADKAAAPSENNNRELTNERLGLGKFGWAPTGDKSAVYLKPSGSSCTEDEQPVSEEIQDNEMEVDTKLSEEKRKENENDSKGSDDESYLYDQLVEAISNGNGKLQEEMMDKILEGFDKVENTNKEDRKGKKGVTKKVRKKAVPGMRTKGRGRGR